ncbi:hypothetical protein OIE13_24335 [Streptosporangium sp. NBC_01810]|uniref:hypothetical protein n=1 Tax=Streptosporangium sp. NBC_01810 TaxID=2975951 RepID=UPI002DDA1992|nr:hypothetical protein [Streptosporangium sp. NBC_01810]WSA24061.1 hypothetical protein OIE13_24335 [Streptosporangium sp. NBC_01810]
MTTGEPEVLGEIGTFLLRFSREEFSGVLRVEGGPGGTLWIRNGLVVAAATPAAPGPESLLLRSGRVSEKEWTDAYAAGAPSDRLAAELAGRGVVGEAGLEAVCMAALFDAVFAMTLYGVESCVAEPAGPGGPLPLLPILPGVGPERLARETARRMEHVAAWRRLDLSMRVRPVPPAVPVPTMLGSDRTRRAVLERANGRRTPRDIAFVLGKGLFAVMSEIARMVEEGALDLDGSGAAPSGAALVPEPGGKDEDPAARLPRRRPGTSRINEVLAPVGGGPAPPRPLLALRSLPPQETGDPGPEGG